MMSAPGFSDSNNPHLSGAHPQLEESSEQFPSSLGEVRSSLGSIESSIVIDGDVPIGSDEGLAEPPTDLYADSPERSNPDNLLDTTEVLNEQSHDDHEVRSARHARRQAGGAAVVAATIAGVFLSSVLFPEQLSDENSLAAGSGTEQGASTPNASGSMQAQPYNKKYTDVKVHYVQFPGADAFQGDKQKVADDIAASLEVLDAAHKGSLGVAEIPVINDPELYDLGSAGVTLEQLCGVESHKRDIGVMSEKVLDVLAQRTPLRKETLDVIITDADNIRACRETPVGHAYKDDVVIYKPKKTTQGIFAHEINHNYNYGHDGAYRVERTGNVVSLSPKQIWYEYDNNHTIAGRGAEQTTVTDPDPLSGLELLDHKVISSEQVVDVAVDSTKEVRISALTADAEQSTKLISLSLKSDTLKWSSSMMLELSTEDDRYTLKAYATTTMRDNVTRGTIAIPLGADKLQLGLGEAEINAPVIIDLGTEKIEITLTDLVAGDNASAGVKIVRS